MYASAPILIRDSQAGDIPAITTIYAEAVKSGTASFEIDPPDGEEMARRRTAVLAASLPYLIAEENGIVTGFCYATVYRPRAAYRFTVENSVYVAVPHRGRKVGQHLMRMLIDRCEKAGRRQMIAVIGDSGNRASIGMHKALGFNHAGIMPSVGWKFGRWLDVVFMTRALGPGGTQPPQNAGG